MSKSIERFFKAAGISVGASEAVFAKQGHKRFGADFEKLMGVISARADGSSVNPYDLKNKTLDLSLHVGGFFSGPIWRAYAEWLANEQLPAPARVLDLGCEAGVVTCFMATLWPDAEIVGVDSSTSAVTVAKELAARLGLKNVSFVARDALAYLDENRAGFDLVNATMSVHELLGGVGSHADVFGPESAQEVEDAKLGPDDDEKVAKLRAVGESLRPDGMFLSLDRIPRIPGSWWYAQALSAAGLIQSPVRSYSLEVSTPSGKERFPLVVAMPAGISGEGITPGEILSLATFAVMPEQIKQLTEGMADVFIRSLSDRETLLRSTSVYVDGSGTQWMEISKTPTLALLYVHTSKGFKELKVVPLVALAIVASTVFSTVGDLRAYTETSVEVSDAGKRWLTKYGVPEPAIADLVAG